jgi:hypothetical protein
MTGFNARRRRLVLGAGLAGTERAIGLADIAQFTALLPPKS